MVKVEINGIQKQYEAGTTYEISVKAVKVVNGTNIYSINNPTIEASTN